jgi:hypothetical protein
MQARGADVCPESDKDCPPPHTLAASDNRHLAGERQQAGGDEADREGEALELVHLNSP